MDMPMPILGNLLFRGEFCTNCQFLCFEEEWSWSKMRDWHQFPRSKTNHQHPVFHQAYKGGWKSKNVWSKRLPWYMWTWLWRRHSIRQRERWGHWWQSSYQDWQMSIPQIQCTCHSVQRRCSPKPGTRWQKAKHKCAIAKATDYEMKPKWSTLTESAFDA